MLIIIIHNIAEQNIVSMLKHERRMQYMHKVRIHIHDKKKRTHTVRQIDRQSNTHRHTIDKQIKNQRPCVYLCKSIRTCEPGTKKKLVCRIRRTWHRYGSVLLWIWTEQWKYCWHCHLWANFRFAYWCIASSSSRFFPLCHNEPIHNHTHASIHLYTRIVCVFISFCVHYKLWLKPFSVRIVFI